MTYYYLFKEENLTEDQKQRLYDLTMELGPRNDVSYREHIAEIRAEAGRAGYLQGYTDALNVQFSNLGQILADEYAAKVRQGEVK